MSKELFWLSLTLAVTALFWLPYVLNRIVARGLLGTLANPSENDVPLAPWAERARCAHSNAVENLVLFAPAIIAVHVLNIENSTTAFASELYFISRTAHYVVYTLGIVALRTLAFFGGWVGTALILYRLLEAVPA